MADFLGIRKKCPIMWRPCGQKVYKTKNIWSIVMILVNYLDNIITIIIPQTLVSNKQGRPWPPHFLCKFLDIPSIGTPLSDHFRITNIVLERNPIFNPRNMTKIQITIHSSRSRLLFTGCFKSLGTFSNTTN